MKDVQFITFFLFLFQSPFFCFSVSLSFTMAANERAPSAAAAAAAASATAPVVVAWYYAAGGGAGPVGPYPEETFRSMAATGTLHRSTPVWSPSAAAGEEWLPLWQAVEKGYLRASLPVAAEEGAETRGRGGVGEEAAARASRVATTTATATATSAPAGNDDDDALAAFEAEISAIEKEETGAGPGTGQRRGGDTSAGLSCERSLPVRVRRRQYRISHRNYHRINSLWRPPCLTLWP